MREDRVDEPVEPLALPERVGSLERVGRAIERRVDRAREDDREKRERRERGSRPRLSGELRASHQVKDAEPEDEVREEGDDERPVIEGGPQLLDPERHRRAVREPGDDGDSRHDHQTRLDLAGAPPADPERGDEAQHHDRRNPRQRRRLGEQPPTGELGLAEERRQSEGVDDLVHGRREAEVLGVVVPGVVDDATEVAVVEQLVEHDRSPHHRGDDRRPHTPPNQLATHTSIAPTALDHAPLKSGDRYKWELLALLWCAYFFNRADKQLYGFVIPDIKADLHLTDVPIIILSALSSERAGPTDKCCCAANDTTATVSGRRRTSPHSTHHNRTAPHNRG